LIFSYEVYAARRMAYNAGAMMRLCYPEWNNGKRTRGFEPEFNARRPE
jgi:hypothetical protein